MVGDAIDIGVGLATTAEVGLTLVIVASKVQHRQLLIRLFKPNQSLIKMDFNAITAIAFYYTGNHHDAEDIAQDVLITRLDQDLYVHWLVRRRCIDKWRKAQRRAKLLEGLMNEPKLSDCDSAEKLLLAKEVSLSVRSAIAKLPQSYEELIRLHYYGDLSQSEIALMLGQPLGTVKSGLRRAQELLREEMANAKS